MPPQFFHLAHQVRELQEHLQLLEESQRELIDAYRSTIEVSRSLRAQIDEANALLARFDGDGPAN